MRCGSPRKKRFSSAGSCSSADIIGGNEDLVTEILILLHAKTVVRFKSVCKQWRCLISGEYFRRRHVQSQSRRRAETQHSFILCDVNRRSPIFMCDPSVKALFRMNLPERVEHVTVLQSMNGLLLLRLKLPSKEGIHCAVFNPTTQAYRFIDLEGYALGKDKICFISDPSKSEYYKIVIQINGASSTSYSVYDSATHKWSHGWNSSDEAIGFGISRAVLYRLLVCYLRRSGSVSDLRGIPDEEAYRTVILDSNGHLNLLQLEENKHCIRVCGLSDQLNWVICKNTRLDLGSSKVEILGMMREDKIENTLFLFHVPGRLLIYRFSDDQELEVLVDYTNHDHDENGLYVEGQLQFQYAHPFIHTFASV